MMILAAVLALQIAAPKPTPVNLGRDMTPTTESMSVSAEGKYIPALYGGVVCTETCPSNHPAYTEWHCSDTRRVLVTTEGGVHLCILFPEPPVVPPVVRVTSPAPKPLAAPKPVPVKLSPPPYDGQR